MTDEILEVRFEEACSSVTRSVPSANATLHRAPLLKELREDRQVVRAQLQKDGVALAFAPGWARAEKTGSRAGLRVRPCHGGLIWGSNDARQLSASNRMAPNWMLYNRRGL